MDHRGISTAYRYADFSPAGNPSTIQNLEPAAHDPDWRGFFPKSGDHFIDASRMLVDDSSFHHHQQPSNFQDGSLISKPTSLQQDFYENPLQTLQLKSSKYLIPARELLNEFCCVGRNIGSPKGKKPCKPKGFNDGGSSSSSTWNQTLDPLELQRRKARLLSMLEEVDRRYARYREQMRSVVLSFEAVAGEGAPAVYSALASRAMSIHFRSLKDGIVGQIRATRNAMGEKDSSSVAGATRGETPRLRMLEQRIRQEKAIQHASATESQPWRPQRGLPERSVSILRAWLFEHFLHPYPTDVDKHILAQQTGLSRSQVSNWFINARVRLWKPMVEEMYMEETKDLEDDDNSYSCGTSSQLHSNPNPNPSVSQLEAEDEKPFPPQQMNDCGSLASIINSSQQEDPTAGGSFRMMAEHMDFASYDHGVSLTLGLHQHSPFFDRESTMVNFQPEPEPEPELEPFPFMDEEPQNLPYKNLTGAQLLHDLAG